MTYDDFMKRLAVSLFSIFWVYGVYSMLSRPESRFDGFLTVIVILSVATSLAITKAGRKKVTLYEYGKWILGGFGTWMFFMLLTPRESPVQGTIAAIGAIGIMVTIIITVARHRLRVERDGYQIEAHGAGGDGIVVYVEEGKRLVLLYSREKDTVFVPSDSKWKQIMPQWSHNRKNEIVARIKQRYGKRLIGKAIGYEESDLDDCMAAQAPTEQPVSGCLKS